MSDTWDQSGFDATLTEYMQHTKRTFSEVLNSKAFLISRKALWATKKADPQSIRDKLGVVMTARTTRSGRMVRSGYEEQNTVARGILANRYRKTGGPWPSNEAAWVKAVSALVASRLRSIAFLRSGWIPAIRILEPLAKDKVGAASRDPQARIFGQEKGSAIPAVEGESMIASIINSALGTGPTGGTALAKYGGAALDLAFYSETSSMQSYLETKLQKLTAEAGLNL